MAGRPLANALVYLSGTSYQAHTDDAGHFQLAGVPAGKYVIGFTHVVLDSMPSLPEPRAVDVRQLQEAVIELGTRALHSQLAEKCPRSDEAVLFGQVRNERAVGVANVVVSAHFNRGAGTRGKTDATGYYFVCDVPLDEPIEVRVRSNDGSAVTSKLRITGRPYRRLDLILKD